MLSIEYIYILLIILGVKLVSLLHCTTISDGIIAFTVFKILFY